MSTPMRRARRLGVVALTVAVLLGALLAWVELSAASRSASPLTRSLSVRREPSGTPVPSARVGLVPTIDNQGKVLFGRYCDSCHPGGDKGIGADLHSVQVKRQYKTLEDIMKVARKGGYDMPPFPKTLLADSDLEEIGGYVLSLSSENE